MGRFIDVRVAERRERLQLFQQDVRQRVREQVNETERVVGRHVRKVVSCAHSMPPSPLLPVVVQMLTGKLQHAYTTVLLCMYIHMNVITYIIPIVYVPITTCVYVQGGG